MNIGIITHFYNSNNYGGVLQAYALTKYLKKADIVAEQIRYPFSVVNFLDHKKRNKKLKYFNPCNYCKVFNRKVKKTIINLLYGKNLDLRKVAFNNFASNISQSKAVFDRNTIFKSVALYDAFITGSDQVWNLDWFDSNYFLEFVPNDKKKISYAASIGQGVLTADRKEYFQRVLPTFDAISVREKETVDLLQPLIPDKKVEWVLDPTLLLEREEWNKICPERRVKEQYLFCYFLGHDKRLRELAVKYAKEHNLKIINLPHLCGICKVDKNFGDYKLYDVAPNDFISLIKYSECVFTDSFHACVFSGIYNKNFYVFNRSGAKNMATRIYTLCELFECQDHFCDCDEKFDTAYIEQLNSINYDKDFTLLKEMKDKSIKFLKEALDGE